MPTKQRKQTNNHNTNKKNIDDSGSNLTPSSRSRKRSSSSSSSSLVPVEQKEPLASPSKRNNNNNINTHIQHMQSYSPTPCDSDASDSPEPSEAQRLADLETDADDDEDEADDRELGHEAKEGAGEPVASSESAPAKAPRRRRGRFSFPPHVKRPQPYAGDALTMERLKYLYKAVNHYTDLFFAVDKDLDYLPKKRGNRQQTDAELAADLANPWVETAIVSGETDRTEIPDTVSAGYGELSWMGFDKILYALQFEVPDSVRMNEQTDFLDIGSGFGKCVMHAKLRTHCHSAIGIEYILTRHNKAAEALFHLNAKFIPGLTSGSGEDFSDAVKDLELTGCDLVQGDITDDKYIPMLHKASHIYAFDVVFSRKTHERMLPRIAQSESLKLFACYTRPDRLRTLGVGPFFDCVHRTKARTTGGQWFTCYFYVPVRVPAGFATRADADQYLTNRIDHFKRVDVQVAAFKAKKAAAVREREEARKRDPTIHDGMDRSASGKKKRRPDEPPAQSPAQANPSASKKAKNTPGSSPSGIVKKEKVAKTLIKTPARPISRPSAPLSVATPQSDSFAAFARQRAEAEPITLTKEEEERIDRQALASLSSSRLNEDTLNHARRVLRDRLLEEKQTAATKKIKSEFEQQQKQIRSAAKAAGSSRPVKRERESAVSAVSGDGFTEDELALLNNPPKCAPNKRHIYDPIVGQMALYQATATHDRPWDDLLCTRLVHDCVFDPPIVNVSQVISGVLLQAKKLLAYQNVVKKKEQMEKASKKEKREKKVKPSTDNPGASGSDRLVVRVRVQSKSKSSSSSSRAPPVEDEHGDDDDGTESDRQQESASKPVVEQTHATPSHELSAPPAVPSSPPLSSAVSAVSLHDEQEALDALMAVAAAQEEATTQTHNNDAQLVPTSSPLPVSAPVPSSSPLPPSHSSASKSDLWKRPRGRPRKISNLP